MTYKETLFFVAKCLTISSEEKNKQEIETQLKTTEIDWEAVVKVSTSHFVFPALYCNLKRVNFLHYLPEELVNYMIHITDLNRDRNQQIIDQAIEINTLLLANNITPIFLKGTGNLLEGLYEDIGERMVGDIDFIVSKDEYEKTFNILIKNSHEGVYDTNFELPNFKHKPRLKKENNIAAVEIHKEMLKEGFSDEFNYNTIKNTTFKNNCITFLSFENQLNLTILAIQINDEGMLYKNIALRNAYDVFLLSKKTNTLKAIADFNILFNPINNFLSITHYCFNKPKSIQFLENNESKNYLTNFQEQLDNIKKTIKINKKLSSNLAIKSRLNIIKKSFFDKEIRNWILLRIINPKWLNQKLVQMGIKKN
jgi:hypothetical protein